MSIKAGILGSTGYTGFQLVSLLLGHGAVDIRWLTSEKFRGSPFSHVFPSLEGQIDKTCVSVSRLDEVEKVDLVFSCLPDITSMHFVGKLYDEGTKIIDLSSDFRIKNLDLFKRYFNKDHTSSVLVRQSAYGLPELNRSLIEKSGLIANPGCFATMVLLSLAPLLENKINAINIVVDIKAPISGAGRAPRPEYHFPESNQNIICDGFEINYQKHEVEDFFERSYGFKEKIILRSHRVPVKRGILTTIYYKLTDVLTYEKLYGYFDKFYCNEKFVRIRRKNEILQLKNVLNSNYCDIRFDIQDGWLLVESVLDNVIKGASGQAVQNMNIMFGLKEDTGLCAVPVFP